MDHEDMTPQELADRLEEVEGEIEELEALEFIQMLQYMEAEGFVEIEDNRIYSIAEESPCSLAELPAKP